MPELVDANPMADTAVGILALSLTNSLLMEDISDILSR